MKSLSLLSGYIYLILGIIVDNLRKKIKWVSLSKIMFVMMADIQLKEGAENDFKTLFSESNKVLSPFPGFVSRRFLKSPDGSCRIIVERENQETFMKMIQSPEHQEFHPKLHSFMSAEPVKTMFTTSVE